jgi:Protein of unknown function (DUF1573)
MTQLFSGRIITAAKRIFTTGFCFILVTQVQAELRWEKQSIELNSAIGQKVIRTAYHFTNIGKTPISVVTVQPSCGCVATALDKLDYAPGESGEIKITFDLTMDEFAALQKRTITVTTSDNPKSSTVLRLEVHVPETFLASPETVIWERGEKPMAKDIVLKAGRDIQAVKFTQITTNDNFSVELKTEAEGKRYRVEITPKRTDAPSYASIDFRAESASFKRPQICEIYLNVQ